jgi:hypothetical protein
LKFHRALGHRSLEAAPVCGPQMLGNDEIETFAERLIRGVTKQSGRGAVPPGDLARPVCIDDGICNLIEDSVGQFGRSSMDKPFAPDRRVKLDDFCLERNAPPVHFREPR